VKADENAAPSLEQRVTQTRETIRRDGIYDTGGFTGTLGAVSPLNYPSSPLRGGASHGLHIELPEQQRSEWKLPVSTLSISARRKDSWKAAGNSSLQIPGSTMPFSPNFLGYNESGIVVGSIQDLTGNLGLIGVPDPLFSNIPFASMPGAALRIKAHLPRPSSANG
jgi:hypothetical protein